MSHLLPHVLNYFCNSWSFCRREMKAHFPKNRVIVIAKHHRSTSKIILWYTYWARCNTSYLQSYSQISTVALDLTSSFLGSKNVHRYTVAGLTVTVDHSSRIINACINIWMQRFKYDITSPYLVFSGFYKNLQTVLPVRRSE